MLSSVARLWPANFGQLGLAWIVGVLRFLHVTFLKSFPSLAVGREHSDENGNSVRKDETGSKSVPSASSGSEPVRDEAVSKAPEVRLSRAPAQTDGSARKGGKERKGKLTGRAHGKCKQKVQKVQKNETGEECGKNCDTEPRKRVSESEDANQERSAEVKNEVKNMDEECFEDCDEEILPLEEERLETEDHNKEDNDIGIIDVDLASDVLRQDVHGKSTNGVEFSDFVEPTVLPVETVTTGAVWPGRNRPRKKRRRAKGSKQGSTVSTPGDRNLSNADNHSRMNAEFNGMIDEYPSSRANCVLALPTANSTMFGGSAVGNSRQKPSARVRPSRSTSAVDCALTSSEYDLSPEPKASLADVMSSVESEIDAVKSPSLFVDLRQNSVNVCSCVEFSEGSTKMSGLSGDVVTPVQRSYDGGIRVGVEASCCDSVVDCFSPSSSFYEPSHFGKCLSTTRTRPQNFVNSHSVFDSTESKLSSHPGLRNVEVRPSYVEPPRFKPRSLVNPLPAGPMPSGANVMVETTAPDVINKPDLISVQGTTTQIIESLVISRAQKGSSGFEERRSSKKFDDDGFRSFTRFDCRSDSFPDCGNQAVVCHDNGFHGNQESSRHSAAKLIRHRTDESCIESSTVRTTRLIAHGQTASYARGNRDHSSSSPSDPIHGYFRNSAAKDGSTFVKKTKDRPPPPPPRSLPKNSRRTGFRTRSTAVQEYIRYDGSQRITEMNFNLKRAQQFLHSVSWLEEMCMPKIKYHNWG